MVHLILEKILPVRIFFCPGERFVEQTSSHDADNLFMTVPLNGSPDP
jgi:hypothetical protein